MKDPVRQPAATPLGQFVQGLWTPWIGLRVMWRWPQLWSYAALPIAMNLFITILVLVALVFVAARLLVSLHSWLQNDWTGYWKWLAFTGEITAGILLLICCFAAAILVWRLLTGILCGYFYGVLANQVERRLGVAPGELREISFLEEAVDTAIDLGWLILVFAISLQLCLIPLVGGPLATAFSLYWQCFINGLEFLAFPLSMRGYRRRQRRAYGKKHRFHTLGLGLATMSFAFIPVVGSVLQVTAAAGAVMLHRQLRLADESTDFINVPDSATPASGNQKSEARNPKQAHNPKLK